mgnify:FL=1
MALRNIVKYGDEVLEKKAREVTSFDDKLAQLIDDMIETLHHADGAGLAANQVGVLKRVCIIDVGDGVIELINPEIIYKRGRQETAEGCLSFPGEYGITRRPKVVKVKAQNRKGETFILKAEDLKAKAICHEVDHLDGILFKQYVIRDIKESDLEG